MTTDVDIPNEAAVFDDGHIHLTADATLTLVDEPGQPAYLALADARPVGTD